LEFKVGDKVKIEGILTKNDNDGVYVLKLSQNGINLTFSNVGRYLEHGPVALELVERAKQKVKKYKVVYSPTGKADNYIVSLDYYKDAAHFEKIQGTFLVFKTIIMDSEKEFEE